MSIEMTETQLFDTLDGEPLLQNRIAILERVKIINLICQPDALLHRFFDAVSLSDKIRVATIFKHKFGKIAICREATYCSKRPITLLDAIEEDIVQFMPWTYLIFASIGFRHSMDCSIAVLYSEYELDPAYVESYHTPWADDYIEWRENFASIEKELIEAVFRPDRVYRWLLSHPHLHVENYAN